SVDDRAGGAARNLPVPRGLNDGELDYLMVNAVLPLADAYAPEAVVVTCGADGLMGDPLSAMALSNGALWRAVLQAVALTRHAVVLGGGGYNPWTVARCWTGLWGALNDRAMPARLPPAAEARLRALDCDLVDEEDYDPDWFTTLRDRPYDGVVRDEVQALPKRVLAP
ncbi:MAG: acetoin utilization protein AcuC, partial [Alphaproteobacteria bacterium]|nr:acetoin utilization protein AcuC [Alphaproteobacteria bacterium]